MGGYHIIVCACPGKKERDRLFSSDLVLVVFVLCSLLLFARLERGEHLIPGWACVRLWSIMVDLLRREGKTLGNWEVKKGNRIQQHGEELIDVCFMDMADRDNCR